MRSIAALLLLSMALQPFAQLTVFKIQQYQIRKEIKQQIKAGVPEDELVLLKIPQRIEQTDDGIFQRIHSREFRYYGKMYDIVRQEIHADVTWYYCIPDIKETALFANLDESVKKDMNHNPARRTESEKLLRLVSQLYFPEKSDLCYASLTGNAEWIGYLYNIKTWKEAPSSPPPQA